MKKIKEYFVTVGKFLGFIAPFIVALVILKIKGDSNKTIKESEKVKDKIQDLEKDFQSDQTKIEELNNTIEKLEEEMEKKDEKTTDDKFSELKSRYDK